MIVRKNLYAHIPPEFQNELSEALLDGKTFRIERIVSKGHCSPKGFWYDQDDNEWVILLRGSAGLRFEDGDELITLSPGDYVHIGRRQKHRVEWTAPDQETVWLAVHYKQG